jgi:hypothetical protein
MFDDHWEICSRSQDSVGKRTVKAPYFEDQENSRKIPENYILTEDRRSRKEKARGPQGSLTTKGRGPAPSRATLW